MNKEQFVEYAKENEKVMLDAIRTFHPFYCNGSIEGEITAKQAEIFLDGLRAEISREGKDPVAQFKKYDADIIQNIANQVWIGMPESMESRNHPAFNLICNLAEGYDDYDET